MSSSDYRFQQTEDGRWGIYFQERLLATVGNYDVCKSIKQLRCANLSAEDSSKIVIAYKRAIDKSLTI
ncbi:MAG: hypothetical protein AAF652_07250 [Cyanobacteria bacterium P01_C01_bin.72]